MSKIKFSFLILIAFNIILNSCKKEPELIKKNKETLSINALLVQPREFTYSIEVNGTIIPAEYVEIKPEIAGRIVSLNIKEGTNVKSGEVLATLYDEDLQAQLRKSESQLEINLKSAERLKKLLDVNGVNVQDYDNAMLQVASTKADIDYYKAQIRKTKILSPFSGTVGLRNVSLGAFVANTTTLTTIQQTEKLKIDFNVPENYAQLVKNGSHIKFLTEESPDTLTAQIIAIEPVVNQSTRNLKVRAIIDKIKNVTAGKFAKVLLTEQNKQNAIIIPTQSIVPDTRFKRVYVIKNGIANLTTINIGIRRENDIEVLSGLNIGDTVAINGILFLKPKLKVKVNVVNK